MTGPCEWPVIYPDCGPPPEGGGPVPLPAPLDGMTSEQVEQFETMAGDYLWRFTEHRFGVCEVTVRLCVQGCAGGHSPSTFQGRGPRVSRTWGPVLIAGEWYNLGCGRCGDTCGCGGSAPLLLPGPIASVALVTIDGETLPPEAYRVENASLLVRLDGQPWPSCGVEVTYTRGLPVPLGGQVAAGVLTVELAKAFCGDATCGLPRRVQSITRQGVTVAILDSFDDVEKGHTGIWTIDSWIASVRVAPAAPRGPVVLSPDAPGVRVRRTTWGA